MTASELEDKLEELVGREYDATHFHCWHLVEELVPKAPKLQVEGGDYAKAIRGFRNETPNYIEMFDEITEDFKDLDVILVGNQHLNHAGVLIFDSGNPLVIHNDIKGVHVEPLKYFIEPFKKSKVFRCK